MRAVAEEHLGIAIVDDDAVFRELTCALLSAKSPFTSFPAASGEELIELLAEQRIDCIVLDYDLRDDTGFAIKTRLDQRFEEPPPVIMLTGDGRESTAIKAFRMGVNDYLPKLSLTPKALVDTIAKVVAEQRKRHSVRAEYKRLVELAAIDLVTGLPGKPHLDERLAQLAGLYPESRRSYAVVLVEMQQYQSITEQFGLKVSDFAVRSFGKQLKLNTRSNDICGRYERGVFLIVMEVKGDPAVLDVSCKRIENNMTMDLDADAAKLKLSAAVVGMICETDDTASLIRGLFSMLAHATEAGPSVEVARSPRTAPLLCDTITPPLMSNTLDALPAADQLRTTDRRRELRQRVLKRGIIHLPGTHATFDCTVRNLSAKGAGLRINTPFAVPAIFDLEIVGSGERRPVHVRWQAGIDLGVEYGVARSAASAR